MKHLAPIELRDMCINSGMTEHTAAVPAILETYDKLKERFEDENAEPLETDETRLLFETALCVMQAQLHGRGPRAYEIQAALIETHGLSYLRPAPPVEAEPKTEPATESETESE